MPLLGSRFLMPMLTCGTDGQKQRPAEWSANGVDGVTKAALKKRDNCGARKESRDQGWCLHLSRQGQGLNL